MKIEIWSDIMCPFCYIGKRKFEAALEKFDHKNDVDVTWHSFQLQPGLTSSPGKNINEYLAEIKSIPLQQAKEMMNNYGYSGVERLLLLLHHYNLRSIGIGDSGSSGAALMKEMVVKMMTS
ncbi:MAG: hypothetical protein EOO03_14755 [Chitinophagaceae bacterium]|nr:MAG: hypothetical protein EOO03_14755 [Chitinophagaceae bacterium]